jgi:hypothetical protein
VLAVPCAQAQLSGFAHGGNVISGIWLFQDAPATTGSIPFDLASDQGYLGWSKSRGQYGTTGLRGRSKSWLGQTGYSVAQAKFVETITFTAPGITPGTQGIATASLNLAGVIESEARLPDTQRRIIGTVSLEVRNDTPFVSVPWTWSADFAEDGSLWESGSFLTIPTQLPTEIPLEFSFQFGVPRQLSITTRLITSAALTGGEDSEGPFSTEVRANFFEIDPNEAASWRGLAWTGFKNVQAAGQPVAVFNVVSGAGVDWTADQTPPACDDIDFNGDGIFPDNQDLVDFLLVFSGAPCPTSTCNDTDFNNDEIFPDNADLVTFLAAFAGQPC